MSKSTGEDGDGGKSGGLDIEISTNVRVRFQSAPKRSDFTDLDEEKSSVWVDWVRPILVSIIAGAILFFWLG